MISLELQIMLALALDGFVGDPSWFPHPVRAIGCLAKHTERVTRFVIGWEWAAGFASVVLITATAAGVVVLALRVAEAIHPLLVDLTSIYCIYFCIALRDLLKHARRVHFSLTRESLGQARKEVAMIVGRDTDALDESGVARAAIESVAESFVDGIAAPLFYAVLLGPLGAVVYRAINTLDSMFGYRTERYRSFGWTAAKLDDAVNYLPSRLSVPFLVLAAGLTGHSMRSASRILFRDRRNHASPNSGLPEAAVAGALKIQLGGPSQYFGKWTEKPTIGDPSRKIQPADILHATRIVVAATITFLIASLLVRFSALGILEAAFVQWDAPFSNPEWLR